jgi:hypothetical protein
VRRILQAADRSVAPYVVAASKIHADDTPIQVLAPGTKKTRTGRLWVYVRNDRCSASIEPAAVCFAYSPDRKSVLPQTHLATFEGILPANAYVGYADLYLDGKIRPAACCNHARRYVFDVHEKTPLDPCER